MMRERRPYLHCLLFLAGLCLPSTLAAKGFVKPSDLPDLGGSHWMDLDETTQFLPNRQLPRNNNNNRDIRNPFARQQQQPPQHRRAEDAQDNEQDDNYYNQQEEQEQETTKTSTVDNSQYTVQPFVEGVSDYDEYQQAWRMLGFMIDCDDMYTDDDGGSGDDGDTGEGCVRFVLWAAYVDLEYEGGGIGEYQYWDRDVQKWDTTACEYTGSSRCAKMDCHLSNTHWSLLGFFKHRSYDDWMEQLFKHEGICLWTDEEYGFMSAARETWPQGCIVSGTTMDSGDYIYYALKPVQGGGITLGLYTDARCVEEYRSSGRNDPITIENVVGNILSEGEASGSGDYEQVVYDSLDESLSAWDSAFDLFKICHPCVAYDINNYGYSNGNYKGSNYGKYNYGYGDDDYYENGNDFDCYDDAGYTNVNQCMKFMAKTTMNTATFRDLKVATSQGTLADSPLAGYRKKRPNYIGSAFASYFMFMVGLVFCVFGTLKFRKARQDSGFAPNWSMNKPLVFA